MRAFTSLRAGAIAAAAVALTALPTQGQAATYVFDLTGAVADAQLSSGGGADFLTLDLAGLTPFVAEVGDEIVLNLILDDFLAVPGALQQFFSIDLVSGADPFSYANTSSSELTVLDGDLAGQSFAAACSNCLAAIAGRFPGGAFAFQNLTATITITGLAEPTEVFGARFGYQLSNNVGVVPEPSAWAVMILGFGLAGGALRRRVRLAAA